MLHATCAQCPDFLLSVEILPFFAYGTLLPCQSNYWLWETSIVGLKPARLANSRLLDMGYYPMLVEGGGVEVKGALVTIKASSFGEILKRLDRLEGFDPANPEGCVFCRVRRTVTLDSGEAARAWLYLGRADAARGARVIESGDWVSHSAPAQKEIRAWWDLQGPEL